MANRGPIIFRVHVLPIHGMRVDWEGTPKLRATDRIVCCKRYHCPLGLRRRTTKRTPWRCHPSRRSALMALGLYLRTLTGRKRTLRIPKSLQAGSSRHRDSTVFRPSQSKNRAQDWLGSSRVFGLTSLGRKPADIPTVQTSSLVERIDFPSGRTPVGVRTSTFSRARLIYAVRRARPGTS